MFIARCRRATVATFVAAILAFLLAGRSDATSIRLSLEEISAASPFVVRGRVERIESAWTPNREIESTVFVRLSEYEQESSLLDQAAGVWLDAFESEWWTLDTVRSLHGRGKTVAIVSPELHKRPHEASWRALKELEPETRNGLMLCTDFPDAASEAFAG